MTCFDCACSFQECVESISSTECPHCSLSECCCWPVIHKDRRRISNSSKREMRLLSLSRKLGHGLDEDFRKAGDRLRNILIRDFERETALTVVFIERNDLTKASTPSSDGSCNTQHFEGS